MPGKKLPRLLILDVILDHGTLHMSYFSHRRVSSDLEDGYKKVHPSTCNIAVYVQLGINVSGMGVTQFREPVGLVAGELTSSYGSARDLPSESSMIFFRPSFLAPL